MCQGRSQGHLKLTQYNIYITVYPKGQTSNEVNWNLILISSKKYHDIKKSIKYQDIDILIL